MGTDNLFKDCYVVVVHNHYNPYGSMVASCRTEKEAIDCIKYQKEQMNISGSWSIVHIKDIEWLLPKVN